MLTTWLSKPPHPAASLPLALPPAPPVLQGGLQVRKKKMPSWPRSWPNLRRCQLFRLCSHRTVVLRASWHRLGQRLTPFSLPEPLRRSSSPLLIRRTTCHIKSTFSSSPSFNALLAARATSTRGSAPGRAGSPSTARATRARCRCFSASSACGWQGYASSALQSLLPARGGRLIAPRSKPC